MPQPRFFPPVLLVAAAAASFALGAVAAQAQPAREFMPVTDAMLQDPAPADWPMWRRTLDGWGYSPLDQVNRDNVGELQMAWSRALPQGTQEVTPLAYGGVVYMPTLTDIIQALDATNGDLIWEYRRDLPDDVYEFVGGNARSMRNIAIYDRQIINISDDDYAYALDVETGDVVWETRIFDYQETPAGHSSGPIIADGRVISGRSCRPRGGARVVRPRRPRRPHRRGAVAAAHGAGPGRARRRDMGRRALRTAGARRLVDPGQLRPGAAADLPGHVGHLAGPQVHARRGSRTPTCITTPHWPSTSRPARSAGTTST